jgi:hypothetical protein
LATSLKELVDLVSPPGDTGPLDEHIFNTAENYGVDPRAVKAIIDVESQYNPKAKSKAGAVGLMQLMPDTADKMGVKDRTDPYQNVEGGTKYLSELMDQFNTLDRALAAYHQGPGGVPKGNRSPTTNAYVNRVKGRINAPKLATNPTTQYLSGLIEGREEGGSAIAGQPVVVGERGPELIIPKEDSVVIPNDYAGMMGPIDPNTPITPHQLAKRTLLTKILEALDNTGRHAPAYMDPTISPELRQQIVDQEGFRGYDAPWPYCAEHNKYYMKAAERLQDGGVAKAGQPAIVGEAGPEAAVPLSALLQAKIKTPRGKVETLPPPGFDKVGGFNKGQFAPGINEGFIKLNTPEIGENPKLKDDLKYFRENSSGIPWEKACEWRHDMKMP